MPGAHLAMAVLGPHRLTIVACSHCRRTPLATKSFSMVRGLCSCSDCTHTCCLLLIICVHERSCMAACKPGHAIPQ